MKCHIDDPMGVFTDFKITSAFAKAVLHQELDGLTGRKLHIWTS